jgi:uncharacterized damage-inducible protein DinB
MIDSLVQALIAHFDSVFEGPNGDYPAILEALVGLTAEQAAWKSAPDRNSIWQIVDHLTASKVWQIEVLEKGEADIGAWTQPAGDESAWQESVTQLKKTHARQKDLLGQLSEEDLFKVPDPAWKKTQLELLLSSAAHEAHHGGQIDYLKGLQAETTGK